uniref:Uncharacterized protein n=1 Tax=Romanomermis culicivorax TaxID=13658 RepID=A0A915JQY0_ROMCU
MVTMLWVCEMVILIEYLENGATINVQLKFVTRKTAQKHFTVDHYCNAIMPDPALPQVYNPCWEVHPHPTHSPDYSPTELKENAINAVKNW